MDWSDTSLGRVIGITGITASFLLFCSIQQNPSY